MEIGPYIRKTRESRAIGLRDFARRIEIEPAYLSKIERGVFPPPSGDVLVRVAKALGENPDKVLALAGKIASDVKDAVVRSEGELADVIRALDGTPSDLVQQVLNFIVELKGEQRD